MVAHQSLIGISACRPQHIVCKNKEYQYLTGKSAQVMLYMVFLKLPVTIIAGKLPVTVT